MLHRAAQVLPGITESLGNAKEPARNAASAALDSIMDIQGAEEVFGSLMPKFTDKNWRMKLELAEMVQRAVSGDRAADLPLGQLVAKVRTAHLYRAPYALCYLDWILAGGRADE